MRVASTSPYRLHVCTCDAGMANQVVVEISYQVICVFGASCKLMYANVQWIWLYTWQVMTSPLQVPSLVYQPYK